MIVGEVQKTLVWTTHDSILCARQHSHFVILNKLH
jgi:hypothetical protein